MVISHRNLSVVLLGAISIANHQALAQPDAAAAFPSRTITIIVPSPAGGGLDTTARLIAEGLRRQFNHPVVIENRAGAATAIGATAAYRAAPDGYTLLAAPNSPLVFLPLTKKSLSYDASKFEPVAITGLQPMVLVVKPQFAGANYADFIAYAKANPGKLNYGSPGVGSGNHLATLMLEKATGTKMVHVPFQGPAPAMQALMRGDIDFYLVPQDSVLGLFQAGKVKIFATGTVKRSSDLPDVPTFRELGLPEEVVLTIIYALAAPPGTPPAIIAKLNAAINAAFKMPDIRERYEKLRIDPTGGTPQDLRGLIASENARWGKVARDAGIQPQ